MRIWFITGASRGFGALITRNALAAGDAVVATARNPQSVIDAVGTHDNLLPLALDVTDEVQAREAAAAAIARFGRIDILLNNAGFGLLGAVEEASADEVERLYAANVFGLLKVTRAVLPHMRRQKSGHILNISSVGGFVSGTGFGVYCSTKFAVEGISEALAEEVAPLGIDVTIVEPGYFRTDFLDDRSLTTSPRIIADYAQTAGAVREKAVAISHNQPGDPAKFAAEMVKLGGMANPPLRMAFGSDTVAMTRAKIASMTAELDRWESVSIGTDFAADPVAA